MSSLRLMGLLTVATLTCVSGPANAAEPTHKFGDWQSREHYAWRTYDVTSKGGEVSRHIIVCYKADPNRDYYFYNPKSGQFWGRGLAKTAVDCVPQQYQLLKPCGDRNTDINKIKPADFEPAAAPPKVTDISPGVSPTTPKDRLQLPLDKPPFAFLETNG